MSLHLIPFPSKPGSKRPRRKVANAWRDSQARVDALPRTLGDKLQELACLSPGHVVSIELLVDHILADLAGKRGGLR